MLDISFEEANKFLLYDQYTGKLYWKKREGNNSFNTRCAGKEAGTSKDADGYLQVTINSRCYRAHRIAYLLGYGSLDSTKLVDHRNTIRDDNRKLNLRQVDYSVNSSNRRPTNTLGHKNIYKRANSYRVRVKRKNNVHQITLPTLEEAIEFRDLLIEVLDEI